MEGPTPVSALIHAATMVTAGIYLLLRLANLFVVSETTMLFISVLGSFTAFFGASTGAAQTDIKKIIAFSTCSQLGYMVAACGMGNFAAAFFHLITHAYFKSLLFLCAGIVIHTVGGEQDMRKMGSLFRILPSTMVSMGVACFALSGVPYFAGFYSKELILCTAYTKAILSDSYVYVVSFSMLVKAAFFTSFYSAKLLYGIFLKPSNKIYSHSDGNDFLTTQIPLIVLSLMSVFGGILFKDLIVGFDYSSTLNIYSDFISTNNSFTVVEYTPFSIKALLTIATFSGYIFYSLKLYTNIFATSKVYGYLRATSLISTVTPVILSIHSFFYNRWYYDALVSYVINFSVLSIVDSLNTASAQKDLINSLTTTIVKNSIIYLNSVTCTGNNSINRYIREYAVASTLFFIVCTIVVDVFSLYN
jgi:NADH:ubiquinone oxidoreductase subunit 5 (subunit L)/multisubunit Na+/H+ antiporter MnhA subunit